MPFTEFSYYSHLFSMRGKKRYFIKGQSVDILDFIGQTISGLTTQLWFHCRAEVAKEKI